LETAIIANDWKGIFDECRKTDSLLLKPETAALMGHAGIMLNRNNESYILLSFISIDSTRRRGWQNWTADFQKKYPKHAIAWYFQGDAFMRNNEKEKAIEDFSKAIEIDPKFALALNARGVAYSLNKDSLKTQQDFKAACEANPTIADFFANRAADYYLGKAPEAAYKHYSKAVELSPDFAIALNGKACSLFFLRSGGNSIDSVSYYYSKAIEGLDIPVFRSNIRTIVLEIENSMYPDQVETPYFKVSDFLDWQKLRKRSITDSLDFFSYFLKISLPEILNVSFINQVNTLIARDNLFLSYLENKSTPDSIRNFIVKAKDKMGVKGKDQNLVQNRLSFEMIYSGLIAPYKQRIPGMNVLSQAFSAENIGNAARATQKLIEDMPQTTIPEVEAIKYAGHTAARVVEVGSLVKQIYDTKIELNRINSDPTYNSQLQAIKARDPAMYERLKPDPGGALADVQRKMIDDAKPYSLICLNSFGYDAK